MAVEFGCSERGQKTVIYRNFEYWKERENLNGTISWRCKNSRRHKCKACLVTCA